MLQMANYEFIRKQHLLLGKSIRQISRETGYSRQVIRKAIESTEIPSYTLTKAKPKPVSDSVKDIIVEWLQNDQNMPVKQRHTAKRIYDRLVDEYRFEGGSSTIRSLVRKLKGKLPEVFVPLDFPPGMFAQFDWGEALVLLTGQVTKVQLFCMKLAHSHKIFVKAFLHQRQEALLQGHVDAFTYFGAVPKVITYDNLKTVVKRIFKGRSREEQDRFVQLRAHYLFESYFCEPGKGHQKGLVEQLVKFARQNFLVPMPAVQSMEELNLHLLECCQAYDQHPVARSKQTVAEKFAEEQSLMLPLPPSPLLCCRSVFVKSNSLSMVQFEQNAYSIPVQFASTAGLEIKAFVDRIEVHAGRQRIAQHNRCLGQKQEVLNYDHYLDLLLQRPGAVPYARALHQSAMPEVYQSLLRQWQHRPGGMKDFIRVLLLHREYGSYLVEATLKEAEQKGMLQYDAIVQLLYQRSHPEIIPPKLNLIASHDLPRITVPKPDLSQYNELMKRSVVH